MFLLLLTICFATHAFQSSIKALTTIFPYRAGGTFVSANINGTYFVNFEVAFDYNYKLLPAVLGVSGLEFQNTGSNKSFSYNVNPTLYSSTNLYSFSYSVQFSLNAFYLRQTKIRYFVTVTNDPGVLTMYLIDNQKQQVSSDTGTKTFTQPLISQATSGTCFFLDLICIAMQVIVNSLRAITSSDGLGKAIYANDTSYETNTNVKILTLINTLKLSSTTPWSFSVFSNSNKLSNLKLNVTFSNDISNLFYNCSLIIVNTSKSASSSFTTASLRKSFSNSQSSENTPLVDNYSSIYFITGISKIDLINQSRISFLFQPTSSYLYVWDVNFSYNSYQFDVFGFFFLTCPNPIYKYMLITTQLCYDSCPSNYFQNVGFCKKCAVTYPCKSCSVTSTNCTECQTSSKTILVNNHCVPCKTSEYYNSSHNNCVQCPLGCVTCQNSSYCKSCNQTQMRVLNNNQCILCLSNTFFDISYPGPICSLCSLGCKACINSSYCTICNASMKLVLLNNQCVSCSNPSYFNSVSNTCNSCPLGCLSCDNLTYCTTCSVPMKLVLVNNLCIPCSIGSYFNDSSYLCESCSPNCLQCITYSNCIACDSFYAYYLDLGFCRECDALGTYFNYSSGMCLNCSYGCLICLSDEICTVCNISLQLALMNGYCEQCSIGQYFQTFDCQLCPNMCVTCLSFDNCTKCKTSYSLIQFKCLNCSDPSNAGVCPSSDIICPVQGMKLTKALICQQVYELDVQIDQLYNIITVCCKFNSSYVQQIQRIRQDYSIKFSLQNIQQQYHNLRINQENKICFDYSFTQSFTNNIVEVRFLNTTLTDRIINPIFNTKLTGSFLEQSQVKVIQVMQAIMNGIASNSGVGVTALAATSSLSFFIGFIQFVQITSLYAFMNASIPFNLKTFLSMIITVQGCPLLPFQVPNPMQNNTLDVKSTEIYEQYEVDLYFLRGNLASILQTLVYVTIYGVLFLCIRFFKNNNPIFKFVHVRAVKRFYSNCAVSIQAVQIIFVFSAAAATTSRNFLYSQHILNFFTASLFILIVFSIPIGNMVFIVTNKQNELVDTDDIYPSIQRDRKGSEGYTFFRTIGLLCTALTIPLVHYVYVVLITCIILSIQMYYILSRNLFKYRILKYLRILHTISYMIFNILFLVFFIITNYFPSIDVKVFLKMGNVSVIILLSVYVLDLLQVIIDIGDITYEKIQPILCKKNKKEKPRRNSRIKMEEDMKDTCDETEPNSIVNLNNKQRRTGMVYMKSDDTFLKGDLQIISSVKEETQMNDIEDINLQITDYKDNFIRSSNEFGILKRARIRRRLRNKEIDNENSKDRIQSAETDDSKIIKKRHRVGVLRI